MTIIALTGYKQSGKSVASKYLQEKYNFTSHNFKDGLIKELKQNFPDLLEEIRQQEWKSVGEDYLAYVEPTIDSLFEEKPPLIRALMKNYGTEVRRGDYPEYWNYKWLETLPKGEDIVVDDLRFISDVYTLKYREPYNFVKIIRIKKIGQVNTDTHQTESEIDSIPADYTIEAVQGDHDKIHSDLDKIIETLKI